MVGPEVVTVEIHRDGAVVGACSGPAPDGQCGAPARSVTPPCAGAELHVRSAPDDEWVFTAAPTARGCPLAWLRTAAADRRDDLLADRRSPWEPGRRGW